MQGAGDTGDDYEPAPDLDHTNGDVKTSLTDWLKWLNTTVGYDGWRLDYVKVPTFSMSSSVHDVGVLLFSHSASLCGQRWQRFLCCCSNQFVVFAAVHDASALLHLIQSCHRGWSVHQSSDCSSRTAGVRVQGYGAHIAGDYIRDTIGEDAFAVGEYWTDMDWRSEVCRRHMLTHPTLALPCALLPSAGVRRAGTTSVRPCTCLNSLSCLALLCWWSVNVWCTSNCATTEVCSQC